MVRPNLVLQMMSLDALLGHWCCLDQHFSFITVCVRVSTIIIKPSQLAIICLSLAEYVAEAFTYECPPSSDILKVIGITTVGELELETRKAYSRKETHKSCFQ